ncbi:MAG TPA: adenylate/guanylate cyclase domain-containing protein [Vineibacter sp.]|nr:adenylate/guanylate cyclase domain-containing protein [Vineibacter sp.]
MSTSASYRQSSLSLRFLDRADESAYQTSIDGSRLRMCRVGVVAGIILHSLYYVFDRLAFSADALLQVVILREVVTNLFLLALLASTWISRVARRSNLVVMAGILGFAVFFGGINTLESTPYIYVANGTLLIIYGYMFIIGDFRLAVFTGAAAAVILVAIVGSARPFDVGFTLLCLLMLSTNLFGMFFGYVLEALRRRDYLNARSLAAERARYRDLLTRVLPEPVADRLNRGESIADLHNHVVVLFADIVGFTPVAARHAPAEIVRWLNDLFEEFDHIIERHGLEKMKTIGDAYMAAHGLHGDAGDCARCVDAGLALVRLTEARFMPDGAKVRIRVGVHAGPALAGIIGQKRFQYDLWGDTVNVASRMEAASRPGAVLVTTDVRDLVQSSFDFEECPATPIKGKGEMSTWIVRGRKPGRAGASSMSDDAMIDALPAPSAL